MKVRLHLQWSSYIEIFTLQLIQTIKSSLDERPSRLRRRSNPSSRRQSPWKSTQKSRSFSCRCTCRKMNSGGRSLSRTLRRKSSELSTRVCTVCRPGSIVGLHLFFSIRPRRESQGLQRIPAKKMRPPAVPEKWGPLWSPFRRWWLPTSRRGLICNRLRLWRPVGWKSRLSY